MGVGVVMMELLKRFSIASRRDTRTVTKTFIGICCG
jgi:hypothetical protein